MTRSAASRSCPACCWRCVAWARSRILRRSAWRACCFDGRPSIGLAWGPSRPVISLGADPHAHPVAGGRGILQEMLDLGTMLTAIVTPFDAQGDVDEDAFVALMSHLAENSSDGFVVAGTTGEASTLTDEEQLDLIGLAVAERPTLPGGHGARTTIVAGTGTNDTRHAVALTERATELGADAILSITPY